jgi:hypothetical protein
VSAIAVYVLIKSTFVGKNFELIKMHDKTTIKIILHLAFEGLNATRDVDVFRICFPKHS